MKKEIEKIYIDAIYYDEAPNTFADKILAIIGVDSKEKRSNLQSRSRWKYLTMVASILNDKGDAYMPDGFEIPVKWNKDLLYAIYWQTSRSVLYPGKTKQLNTKEFYDLVEAVMYLMAFRFDIHIEFPNWKQLVDRSNDLN